MAKKIQRQNHATVLLESSIKDFQAIFEHAPTAIIVIDQYGQNNKAVTFRTYQINPAAFKLFACRKPTDLFAQFPKMLERWESIKKIDLSLKSIGLDQELIVNDFNGKKVNVIVKTAYAASSSNVTRWVITFQDITLYKRREQQLRKLAQVDSLTGLLNHKTVMARLTEEMARAKRYQLPLSCLILDLNSFKLVNDHYGHLAGDKVIKKFAEFVKRNFRESDIIGRLGGDEFLVVLTETPVEAAVIPAQRLRTKIELNRLSVARGKSIVIEFTAGAAVYDVATIKDAKSLIAQADNALYKAKKSNEFISICPIKSR